MSGITEIGARVDNVQIFLILMMIFWFVACNAVMVYFLLKYRRTGPNQQVSTAKGNHLLEVIWTIIPTILVFIIFYYGINVWKDMRTPPADAIEYQVRGRSWAWVFTHPNGEIKSNELYVPQGKPVKLVMRSEDVLHSLFIPEFRVKEDVVPSIYTSLWFKADKAGTYNIFCTEYCGDQHSGMLAKVHVLDIETWERFENKLPLDPNAVPLSPEENGSKLFVNNGCLGCHSLDGSQLTGPSFQGIFGKQEQLADGSSVTVDENYIVESIKYPNKKIVAGYPEGKMLSFAGILTDDDISDIITYIKTLK